MTRMNSLNFRIQGASWHVASLIILALVASTCGDRPEEPGVVRSTLPAGFTNEQVFGNLNQPTSMRFAPDGYVFIAEKSGLIKAFPSLTSQTPIVVADLRTEVYDYWDRGLLDIILDPAYPSKPYLYALYALDGRVGDSVQAGTVPRYSDACTQAYCVGAGRLVRLTLSPTTHISQGETVLIENWGMQFPSHSIGSLAWGPDGYLYISGGEGASFVATDYGNFDNPLGDPPTALTPLAPPAAQGGALRAQIVTPPVATPPFPTWFAGKIIKFDTVAGVPLLNPLTVPVPSPVVASGLRNPFRITFRPSTNELWIGDVGWNDWEEINVIPNVTAQGYKNFGWPCYEGAGPQPGYQSTGLAVCQNLYGTPGAAAQPFYAYNHASDVIPGDGCGAGGSAVSGLAFYTGNNYPSTYHGALFFSDYSRQCIWAIPQGANGNPDPSLRSPFLIKGGSPVQLQMGPDGNLYYVDISGSIHRVVYSGGNHPPSAVVTASATAGPLPLLVTFDASASVDPDLGDTTTFSWDLNGDGQFGDSVAVNPTFTYSVAGPVTVSVRVTDQLGASSMASVIIQPGSNPPVPTISVIGGANWKTGDTITFSGTATDPEDGTLGPQSFSWSVRLYHCPRGVCHLHVLQQLNGVPGGSFLAPDHDYPSYLEIALVVSDSSGFLGSTAATLNPATAELTLDSNPPGMKLALNQDEDITPFVRTEIVKATMSVAAPDQFFHGVPYKFVSWSDGGAQSHNVIAGSGVSHLTAQFQLLAATNQTPIANAGADKIVLPEEQVTLEGSGSYDLNNDPLTFAWTQIGGPSVILTNPSAAEPGFTALGVASPTNLIFSLTVSDGVTTSAPDTVVITIIPIPGANLSSLGTPIALITAPTGGGSRDLNVIRDGVKPPQGSTDSASQYDTYTDGTPRVEDWVGYSFDQVLNFNRVIFEDGKKAANGGWFDTLAVEVRQGTTWVPVTGLRIAPVYTGGDGISYKTFTLDFDPIPGNGIRIVGAPGGAGHFISVGELEVYATQSQGGGTPSNDPPVGNAGPNQSVLVNGSVTLDGTASYDLHGSSILYTWTQLSGPPVSLSSQFIPRPTFTAPSSATTLTFGLIVSNGTIESLVSQVQVSVVTASGSPNITASGQATALIMSPLGGGNHDIGVIHDGVKPAVGSTDSSQQYDTWAGGGPRPVDWIGYTFGAPYTFTKVVFQEGKNFGDGGWFDSLTVQVRQTGNWVNVSNLQIVPVYGGNNGINFETFNLTFDAVTGDGIRIYGAPGGTAHFVSVGELEVYGTLAGQGVPLPPVANAGTNKTVIVGQTVTLNGSGSSDSGGAPLTFTWTQIAGTPVALTGANTATPAFTAPNVPTTLTFGLIVNNGTLNSAPSQVQITVVPTATVPVANAGADQAVAVGQVVTLNGAGSSDPGGAPLTYGWSQTSGPAVTLMGANTATPTFTAPSSPTTLSFALMVNNGSSNSAVDQVQITVAGAGGNQNLTALGQATALITAPMGGGNHDINVIRDGVKPAVGSTDSSQQYDTWAGGGARAADWIGYTFGIPYTFTKVVFQEGKNFPDGGWFDSLTVQVRQSGNWVSVSNLQILPAYAGNNGINFETFSLTFPPLDGDGIRVYGTPGGTAHFVSVGELEIYGTTSGQGVPLPPVANAGSGQMVTAGHSVTLDGTGSSDPAGAPLTYNWSQMGGTPVALIGSNGATPTFTAPSLSGTLTFGLVVNNGSSNSSLSQVQITVVAAGVPVANAGADQTVTAGQTVALNGTGSSDPGGAPLTYGWTQTSGTPVTLTAGSTATPTFTAPSSPTTLTFGLVVSNGSSNSAVDQVQITVSGAAGDQNLTALGQATALIGTPMGGGNHDINVIRDGVKPAVGSTDSSQQYDTWAGGGARAVDWIGYTFGSAYNFTKVVFQEGKNFTDGGWFDTLTVQVRQAGNWVNVSNLQILPAYAGNNGINFETFNLTFGAVAGDGIRIYGTPGGTAHFVSVGELEVYGTTSGQGVPLSPVANAGGDQTVPVGQVVLLDGTGSSDPGAAPLTYNWSQMGGPTVALAGINSAKPTFTAPSAPSILTFGLIVNNGTSNSPVDQVQITVVGAGAQNLTSLGQPTALITAPQGGGNHDINVIHDGVKPAAGSTDSAQQYDTWSGGGARAVDWIGYTFGSSYNFTKVVFQEGKNFGDGGWFDSLTVQIRQAGSWVNVSNLQIGPAYPGNNGVNFEAFNLTFTPASGDGIRIYGVPGGVAHFISVGELEVFGAPSTP